MHKALAFAALPCLIVTFFACGEDDPAATGTAGGGDGGADSTTEGGALPDGAVGEGGVILPSELVETSGTRIRLQHYVAADGFRMRAGYYDTQLGIACSPSYQTFDGVRRCVPDAEDANIFADDACTQPLVQWSKCAPRPTYAVRFDLTTKACELLRATYFAVGADIANPTPHFKNDSGGCQPYGPPSADKNYAAAGAEVAPSTFAEVTLAATPLAPNLEAVHFRTADGLKAFEGWRDPSKSSVPCTFIGAADGALRCLPRLGYASGNVIGYHADPGCTSELAVTSCSGTSFGQRLLPVCPAQTRIYRTTAEHTIDAGVFEKQPDAGCAPVTFSLEHARLIGAEIPPVEFALATPVTSTATTRLRPDLFAIPGGATLPLSAQPVNDSAKGEPCYPQRRTADGKTRCLPASAYSEEFADDACSIPVARVNKITCNVPKFSSRTVGTGCAAHPVFRPMLGKRASGQVYRVGNAGCEPVAISDNHDVYDVGAEIPETEWEELTRVNE